MEKPEFIKVKCRFCGKEYTLIKGAALVFCSCGNNKQDAPIKKRKTKK